MVYEMQNTALKAGRVVTFSSGEYSDYGYRGSFVALCDVAAAEMDALADEARAAAAEEDHDPQDHFLAAMIRRGWLLEIPMQEIHIGSYGELSIT